MTDLFRLLGFGTFIIVWLLSACKADAPSASNDNTFRLIQLEEPIKQAQIQLTPDITVPAEAPGYTLILPDSLPFGMVVLFHSGRDTTHPGYEQRLYLDAVQRKIAALYVTTGNPFEFLFDSTGYKQLDRFIGTVLDSFSIPRDRLLFAGMSLAGTRAVKFGKWCMSGHSQYGLKPHAIAVCDAPLDFHRFWQQGQRALNLKLNPTSMNEASWVNGQLERNLGGKPEQVPEAYSAYSPYVFGMHIDTSLSLLREVAFRAYTEPDVHWWIQHRGKAYYSMNALDAAAIVNDLKLLGNTAAELITTSGKGQHPNGSRHPHSWSIVDNGELMDWFAGLPD